MIEIKESVSGAGYVVIGEAVQLLALEIDNES